jgi:ABC-type multidrug transport system fused ATPase/permease subunit
MRKTIGVVALGAAIGAGVPVLLAALLENIQHIGQAPGSDFLTLAAAFIAVKALDRITGELGGALFSIPTETLAARLGVRLAQKTAARRVSSKARDDLGELGALQEKTSKAASGAYTVFYTTVLRMFSIVISVGCVGAVLGHALGWHAPVLIAAGGGVYWCFMSAGRGREAMAQRDVRESYNLVARRTAELIGNARLTTEYAAQDFMNARIETALHSRLASTRRFIGIQLLRSTSAAAGIAACYGIAMAYAWFFMRDGTLGVGAAFLLVTYVDRVIAPLDSVSNYITSLRAALIAMEVCEELEVFPAPQTRRTASGVQTGVRATATDAAPLGFTFAGKPPVRIQPGEAALVAGPSGAGKSSLLSRIYEQVGACADKRVPERETTAGEIDGANLAMNELVSCFPAHSICYLPSQPILLPGTVRENILLGHDALANDLECAVWPGVWPEIPGIARQVTLETDIGELSAGERQRVGLARVLLRRPACLILDEATNALDLASEREIWRFIRAWLPGAVLLVAAHRTENFVDIAHRIQIRDGRVESVV